MDIFSASCYAAYLLFINYMYVSIILSISSVSPYIYALATAYWGLQLVGEWVFT